MSNSNQEIIESRLATYIDGELAPAERGEIEAYLSQNPQHRRLLEDLRRGRELLRNLPRETAPPEFAEAFANQIERSVLLDEPVPAGPRRIGSGSLPRVLAIAAILLLTVGLGTIVYFVLPGHNARQLAVMKTDGSSENRKANQSSQSVSATPAPSLAAPENSSDKNKQSVAGQTPALTPQATHPRDEEARAPAPIADLKPEPLAKLSTEKAKSLTAATPGGKGSNLEQQQQGAVALAPPAPGAAPFARGALGHDQSANQTDAKSAVTITQAAASPKPSAGNGAPAANVPPAASVAVAGRSSDMLNRQLEQKAADQSLETQVRQLSASPNLLSLLGDAPARLAHDGTSKDAKPRVAVAMVVRASDTPAVQSDLGDYFRAKGISYEPRTLDASGGGLSRLRRAAEQDRDKGEVSERLKDAAAVGTPPAPVAGAVAPGGAMPGAARKSDGAGAQPNVNQTGAAKRGSVEGAGAGPADRLEGNAAKNSWRSILAEKEAGAGDAVFVARNVSAAQAVEIRQRVARWAVVAQAPLSLPAEPARPHLVTADAPAATDQVNGLVTADRKSPRAARQREVSTDALSSTARSDEPAFGRNLAGVERPAENDALRQYSARLQAAPPVAAAGAAAPPDRFDLVIVVEEATAPATRPSVP